MNIPPTASRASPPTSSGLQRSTRRTPRPLSSSSSAATRPVMPAPMTTTSACVVSGLMPPGILSGTAMSVSRELGERGAIEIPAGTIEYRERGSGPSIVFVHGVGVNGDLWRRVVPELAGEYRCIAPDLPHGSHSHPLRDGTDLSLPGLARIVVDFLEALDLQDVAIVANDTGGAVAQWLVGHHAERLGALVLTSCDAFEKFPPRPQLYLKPAARVPGLLWLVARSVQWKAVQRLPTAYGWTTRGPIGPAVMRAETGPGGRGGRGRRGPARLLRAG